MKRILHTYTLTLKDGRRLSVGHHNNRVEAFDTMRLMWPVETEGYTFRDVVESYAGKTNM